MRITFQPSQLGAAIQAAGLKKAAEDLFSSESGAELAVLQRFRDDPMLLIYRGRGGKRVTVSIDREMLYSASAETAIRARLEELRDLCVQCAANPPVNVPRKEAEYLRETVG